MENILTDKQKLDILNTFEKIYDNIKSIVTQLWKDIKEFLLKSEKAYKYLKIYYKTHNNRIKKKQIAKIVKLFKKNIKNNIIFDKIRQ